MISFVCSRRLNCETRAPMTSDDDIIPSGPFKGKKIECAPTSGIDMFQTIAEDFMKRVIGLDAGDYLISDESSVFDFVGQDGLSKAEVKRRVLEAYDLDISEVKAGNLLDILRLIHRRESGNGGSR